MAERSTIFVVCIVAALTAGVLGGFGASLLQPTSQAQSTRPELVMLTGSGELPPGDKVFCAPAGAVLTLNPHARLGETKQVLDCSNGATARPTKIQPAADAAIKGPGLEALDGSFSLSLDGQTQGFIRVPGHWQEF